MEFRVLSSGVPACARDAEVERIDVAARAHDEQALRPPWETSYHEERSSIGGEASDRARSITRTQERVFSAMDPAPQQIFQCTTSEFPHEGLAKPDSSPSRLQPCRSVADSREVSGPQRGLEA